MEPSLTVKEAGGLGLWRLVGEMQETRQLRANQEPVLARRWRPRQRRNKKENFPTAKTLTSVTFGLSS